MTSLVTEKQTLTAVIRELGPLLITSDRVKPHTSVATGHDAFDNYVLWGGLPKGALSLFYGRSGLGATSLWSQAAARVTQDQQWSAWINGPTSTLCPWALKRLHVRFEHLLWSDTPKDNDQLLWALQELISLSLFELIGCDLGRTQFREHQLIKLHRLARQSKAAVVLFSERTSMRPSSQYALIVHFQKQGICLQRAQHRPTPHLLPRRDTYADFMPQLAEKRTLLSG